MTMIRVLPDSVVNQIAAGEVIERPASVVKELVENALDAGAQRVTIDLFEGGKRRIRVVDEGAGMAPDDLELAFLPHATSKLERPEDLFRVSTLGFRGEALASIGAVSRARIVSRTRGSVEAHEISNDWGALGPVRPAGAPLGTTVEVEQLFGNLPARRRFLKSDATEFGHVSETVTRLALSHPAIRFRLRHNERDALDLPAAESDRARIGALFGSELSDVLIPVSARGERISVRGLVGAPSRDRSRPDRQYVFLNGRFVRDRGISHAIFAGYEGFLMAGRHAMAFLYVELDPAEVDVNVHPTKIEVRIRPASDMHTSVVRAVREALTVRSGSLAPLVRPRAATAPLEPEVRETAVFRATELSRGATGPFEALEPEPAETAKASGVDSGRPFEAESVVSRPVLQIHSSFLLREMEDGFAIVDQHALHEGILSHRLKERVRSGPVLAQRLLVPQVVELSPRERAIVLEHKTALEPLGLILEPFGDDAIAVQGVPAMLHRLEARPLVRDLATRLASGEIVADPAAVLDAAIDLAACKGAVRAGEPLTQPQIHALLRESDLLPGSYACAHGRPHTVRISRREMERWFRRH